MAMAFDGIRNLGQDNLQTAMKGFGAITKGVQMVASEIADYNQAAIERGAAFVQDLAKAGDLGEALQIQTNYLKSSYDGFASELEKLSEIWKEMALEATRSPARKPKVQ